MFLQSGGCFQTVLLGTASLYETLFYFLYFVETLPMAYEDIIFALSCSQFSLTWCYSDNLNIVCIFLFQKWFETCLAFCSIYVIHKIFELGQVL